MNAIIERPTFTLVIDYDQSLADMINACQLDWHNPDINDRNFPIKGQGKKEVIIELFHFKKVMISKEVVAEIKKQDFKPAKLEELLALSQKEPELQSKIPHCCLGFCLAASGWQRRRALSR